MDNIVFVKTVDIDTKTIDAKNIKNNLINQQPIQTQKNNKVTPLKHLKPLKPLKSIIKKPNSYSYINSYSCIFSYICCECYNKENLDSRCCGICFYCGDYIYCDNEKKYCYNCITSDIYDIWCFNNPNEYFKSGMFLTSGGYGNEPDICCTLFAGIILCKFALTLPCLICSTFNGTINCICRTNRNYLF